MGRAAVGQHAGDDITGIIAADAVDHHHQLGRDLLLRLATSAEAQERARQAATHTLELAEELQHLDHSGHAVLGERARHDRLL